METYIEFEISPVPVTAVLNLSTGSEVGIGAEINIKCEVDGHPYPNITWYYNEQELHSTGRIQIVNDDHLVIRGATPEDSGEYTCTARNEYSHASHTEKISVQGGFYFPFGDEGLIKCGVINCGDFIPSRSPCAQLLRGQSILRRLPEDCAWTILQTHLLRQVLLSVLYLGRSTVSGG